MLSIKEAYMWQYNYSPELYHYGVMGMRWGVRHDKQYRAQKKNLKSAYRQRNRKIQNNYDKIESSIDSKYKVGQRLSDSDYAKQVNAAAKMGKQWDASKKKYKTDLAKLKTKTANRLYPTNSKKVNDRIVNRSTLSTLGKVFVTGSYGAMKYDQLRDKDVSKGKAYAISLLKNWSNNLSGGRVARNEYIDNRILRKKKG